ncbi:DUF6460 domain-containing protein [Tepidicaulis sp.]|uniref:DUF6460 domain-containing protein n=1 Tax=Tepidicaulis sp. TaxID=1920809 RepID=UPI003B5CF8CA
MGNQADGSRGHVAEHAFNGDQIRACVGTIGAVLSVFDISAIEVVKEMGLTPEAIRGLISRAFEWALPHFILGAMVIIPIWLIIYLLRPPGLGK